MFTKHTITTLAATALAASAVASAAVLTAAPAQSDPCSQWSFNGVFTFKDSNGWTMTADTRDNLIPRGRVLGKHTGGMSMVGTITGHQFLEDSGSIEGRNIQFSIEWANYSQGHYLGIVHDDGFARGHNWESTNAGGQASWESTAALVCAPADPAPSADPEPSPNNNLPYGPDTCVEGYVWREARDGDTVCVTPEVKARTAQENADPRQNRDPVAMLGTDTCLAGFVWREAFDGDSICVTPDIREATWADNAAADSRYARNQPQRLSGLIVRR